MSPLFNLVNHPIPTFLEDGTIQNFKLNLRPNDCGIQTIFGSCILAKVSFSRKVCEN